MNESLEILKKADRIEKRPCCCCCRFTMLTIRVSCLLIHGSEKSRSHILSLLRLLLLSLQMCLSFLDKK